MERKFKHKLTNKVIKIGGKAGLSCQTLIGNSNLILGDIIKGEDWEEVVEKDYEILSFKTRSGKLSLLQSNGNYFVEDNYDNVKFNPDGPFKGYTAEEELTHGSEIYSVKRLSDGEIFTVGDNTNQGVIENILLVDNNILFNQYVNSFKSIQRVKQPLFTTEVVKKDYEILSFKSKSEQYRILDTDTGLYKYFEPGDHKLLSKEYLIQEGSYQIHSVKRLSDGEVFTVGDKVDSTISDLGRFTDLTYFKLYNNKILFGLRELGYYPLSTIIKYKKPLFTTEDGVDIYEGDTYYELITPDFHNKPCIWNILPDKARGNINYDQEGNRKNGRIWFSTKEAVEEYILMNKSKYSLNDILASLPNEKCKKYTNIKQMIENLKNM